MAKVNAIGMSGRRRQRREGTVRYLMGDSTEGSRKENRLTDGYRLQNFTILTHEMI